MRKSAIIITLIMGLYSCEDFFEPNLSGTGIEVISPISGAEITEGEIVFNWELLHGADRYRLIVVTPDFASAANTVCDVRIEPDSTAHNVSHTLQLHPGTYQWSVQGVNNTSESDTKTNTLTILDDSMESDLSGSNIEVISPMSGVSIPEGEIVFNWELLQGADQYRLVVVTPDFESALSTLCDIMIESDSTAYNASHTLRMVPGTYQWSVQGLNGISKSDKKTSMLTILEDSPEEEEI